MFEGWRKKPVGRPASEVVGNEEKARVMAEAEDPEREFLSEFKRYIADPVAYRAVEDARLRAAREQGSVESGLANDFMYLCQEGVSSSDLEQLAVNAGTMAGQTYDAEQVGRHMSARELRIWLAGMRFYEKVKFNALERAMGNAVSPIDLFSDPRGLVVAEKLRDIFGHKDPSVNQYDRAYRELTILQEKIDTLEQILEEKAA